MEICAKYEKQANSQLYFHICQQSTDKSCRGIRSTSDAFYTIQ